MDEDAKKRPEEWRAYRRADRIFGWVNLVVLGLAFAFVMMVGMAVGRFSAQYIDEFALIPSLLIAGIVFWQIAKLADHIGDRYRPTDPDIERAERRRELERSSHQDVK